MTRIARALSRWRSVTMIGFLAMLLMAPSAAWASSRRDDSARHRGFDSNRPRVEHAHGHPVFYESKSRGRGRGHRKHPVAYFCSACNHTFGARSELYDHAAYRHGVPSQNLGISIRFGEFGWIFFGS
jgi:hypothetical protein